MGEYCPRCRANIGFGVFDFVGCPLCGAEPDNVDDNDDNDEEAEE